MERQNEKSFVVYYIDNIMNKIIIKNIHVLDPERKLAYTADLSVEDGKLGCIKKVTPSDPRETEAASDPKELAAGERIIDGTGLCLAPGLVDVHVHFRDPGFIYKEDIHTGAMAAAKGGFTSVVMMGNTRPPLSDPAILKELLARAAREKIRIYAVGTVTKEMQGLEAADYRALKEAGAAGFSDDGKPVTDEKLLRRAFSEIAALKLPVSLHEEDPAYIRQNGVNAGKAAAALGLEGSDREAEISMVRRDIALAKETGVTLDIQHISTKEAVALVRKGKEEGVRVIAEATPHHFSLTEEAVGRFGTLAKMNPPLREEADRLSIIEGLQDGTIDMIATDHAPHANEEKALPFPEAPSGIIGLETALALGITELVEKEHLSLLKLMELMSSAPARAYGLPAGTLEEGKPADLLIFDPKAEWTVEKPFASKAENSPFIGRRLTGKVCYTICRGEIVYEA